MTKDQVQQIVVSGLLISQNKALVIQRSRDEIFLPGRYELPGGKVNFGEDPQSALRREFEEEVNVKIRVIQPVRTFSYLSEGGRRHTVEIVYRVEPEPFSRMDIRLSADHIAYRWVGLNDVEELDASEEVKENIRMGFASCVPSLK